MASYVAPYLGTAAVQGPTAKPDDDAQVATYNADGSFAGWATPIVQDANGDVTFTAGKVRFYTPNTQDGEIDFCTPGVQANYIVSFPRSGNRESSLLRYRDTVGVPMGEQCSLQGLRLDSTRSTSMVREIRNGVEESLIIGTSVVATTGIPTQRYLTYDTLDKLLIAGVPVRPPSVADDDAPNDTIYKSTDAGKLVYKDESGVVNALYV